MNEFRKRLAVPTILAVFLTSMVGAVALASAPWNGTCDVGELCIFYDRGYAGPDAAMADSNASYHGETYPGLNWGINDSASSVKNRTSSYVKWRHEVDYGGAELCVPSGWWADWVGLGHNDAFTSHLVSIYSC